MKYLLTLFLTLSAAQAATLTIGTAYVQNMSITTLTNGVGGGSPPEEPTGLTNNLVSYWSMDETSGGTAAVNRADSVGSETLTEGGAYLSSAVGKVGFSADFESANLEYLNRNDSVGVNLGNNNWSFAGWLYFDSLANAFYRDFVSKWNLSANENLEFDFGWDHVNAQLFFAISTNGTSATHYAKITNAISTGTWYFTAFGHDADNDQIWVSLNAGTKATTACGASGPNEGTQPLRFGHAPGAESEHQHLEGRADEWGLWKRVLSSDDLTALYNSGSGLNPLSE